MPYTPLSDFLVSDIASELGPDAVFAALTSAQYIPMFNSAQAQIANLYSAKGLTSFQVEVADTLVTTGTRSNLGTYGYIVTIDMSTSKPKNIFQVVARKVATNVNSTPVVAADSLENLLIYPESAGCPDVAFTQNGNSLILFLKTATYPFTTDSAVSTFFYRNTEPVTLVSSSVDVPNEARKLFGLMVLEQAYRTSSKRLPAFVLDQIQEQKNILGLF